MWWEFEDEIESHVHGGGQGDAAEREKAVREYLSTRKPLEWDEGGIATFKAE